MSNDNEDKKLNEHDELNVSGGMVGQVPGNEHQSPLGPPPPLPHGHHHHHHGPYHRHGFGIFGDKNRPEPTEPKNDSTITDSKAESSSN